VAFLIGKTWKNAIYSKFSNDPILTRMMNILINTNSKRHFPSMVDLLSLNVNLVEIWERWEREEGNKERQKDELQLGLLGDSLIGFQLIFI